MAAAEVVVPVVPPPLLRLGEIIWEMGKSLITESTAAKDRWRNFIRPCAIMSWTHTHDNVDPARSPAALRLEEVAPVTRTKMLAGDST